MLDRRAALRRLLGFVASSPILAGLARAQEGSVYPPQYADEVMGPVNLHEFEPIAKQKLHKMAYDFIAGGVEDEVTLRANRESFECLRLVPRVMTDVSNVDTSVEVLGTKIPAPILLAPTGGKNPRRARGRLGVRPGGRACWLHLLRWRRLDGSSRG